MPRPTKTAGADKLSSRLAASTTHFSTSQRALTTLLTAEPSLLSSKRSTVTGGRMHAPLAGGIDEQLEAIGLTQSELTAKTEAAAAPPAAVAGSEDSDDLTLVYEDLERQLSKQL